MDRNLGKNILKKYVTKEKNREILEKNIYNYVSTKYGENSQNEYLKILYEICMKLSQDTSLNEINSTIKNSNLEWNSLQFNNEKKIQQEKDEFLTNPFQIEEGVMKCDKCGSKKTYHYSKQVRAADEGFSTFCFCMACNNKWRIN